MPLQKLLFLTTAADVQTKPEWREIFSGFDIIPVTSLAAAHLAMEGAELSCALMQGAIPGADRMTALEALNAMDPLLPVVFYDPEMTAAEAVGLVRAGAYHCLGFRDSLDCLRECLDRAVEERRCLLKIRSSADEEPWRNLLIGESAPMRRVAHTIRLIGSRRCTVLITGESGTGKELAARAIHLSSPRANQPWVAINCSALPEHLLEAELFGHVKGAFTGAVNSRAGRFEQAHKGTLFLDEIGDMNIDLQAKLLRVLQSREFQRLGSSEDVKVDVRVIAASNANLLERVRQGKFREDLYYRLNVVPLQLPPLRERQDDIPLLVYHFVRKICQLENIPLRRLSPEVLGMLGTCSWPGNVRQLENTVEMAIALSGDRDILYPRDFGLSEIAPAKVVPIDLKAPGAIFPAPMGFDAAVSQFERSLLSQALAQAGGNKTAAAELLGMKRTTLIMKLRSFDAAQLRAV